MKHSITIEKPEAGCSPEAADADCPCGGFYVYDPSSSSEHDDYICHDCGGRP